MKKIKVQWRNWYGKKDLILDFPDIWEVKEYKMKGKNKISSNGIKKAFSNPIGTLPLDRLAKGKKNAIILVDDLSRPTKAYKILPYIFEQLRKGGIEKNNISILVAIGAHRPLNRLDIIKKIGKNIAENYAVYNHFPYENCVSIPNKKGKIQIEINKIFMESDLRIAISFLMPHPFVYFRGGAKIVVPGIAGIKTLQQTHKPALFGLTGGMSSLENNKMRNTLEEIVKVVGLDFVINVVGNFNGDIAGLYVGDFIQAHRLGVKYAQEEYSTPRPEKKLDIVVLNAFPCDTEFSLSVKAFNLFREGYEDVIKKDGAIVIISASSEGRGIHYLSDKFMSLYVKYDSDPRIKRLFNGRKLIIFSKNVTNRDVFDYYPKSTLLFKKWDKLIEELSKYYPYGSQVGVFPCSSLQFFD